MSPFLSSLLRSFVLLCLLGLQAAAQIQVRAEMPRRHWVKGEAIVVNVTITNHSGRTLTFNNVGDRSWLELRVTDDRGQDILPARGGLYRPAQVINGRSITKQINVSGQFNMHRLGRVGIGVSVALPESPETAYVSNRVFAEIHEGTIVHRRRVGLPSDPDVVREFRTIQLNETGRVQVYAQVFDITRQLSVRTTYLGESLNFQAPKAGLDGKTNYHILFQNNPSFFTHVTFDSDGKLLAQSQHKRVGAAVPKLVSEASGRIVVLGGAPYDPGQEQARQLSIHKLSDRPR